MHVTLQWPHPHSHQPEYKINFPSASFGMFLCFFSVSVPFFPAKTLILILRMYMMPTHESPLSSTHALPALSVTCRDRNSSRLWCVLMLRIAQREGGDSALAGYPVPRAKIGSRKIKIARKREVGLRVVPLFSSRLSCKVSYAACTPAGQCNACFEEKNREVRREREGEVWRIL